MKDSIILEGKIYISARRAAKIINYAQDYIGQLCRAGKLDSKMVGRSWFVTEESLLAHRESAVDATQERISKIVQEAQLENIKSQIEVNKSKNTTFTYESEKTPLLPPIVKNAPTHFSIPKNPIQVFPSPISKNLTASTISLFSPTSSLVALSLIALIVGGSIFTLSILTSNNSRSSSNSHASLASVLENTIDNVAQMFGITLHNPSREIASHSEVNLNSEISSNFNGIGVVPSISLTQDEIEKNKIKNSFSDEVTIQPDTSGTSGVITPVFKKTNGDDFVYVLVPVKDKKQQ